jgi:DHA3 family macrolide efflux protein-like MFS transporter
MENGHELANHATFTGYLLFWSGQLVSLLGSSIVQFAIIWWITVTTGSALYLAVATFLGLAPIVAFGPVAGVFADRWNRKKLVFVADMMQALAIVVLVMLFWTGRAGIWQMLAILTFRAVFQAFHEPTVSAITPSMVPRDKLSRMNGLNYLFSGAVRLVGPVSAAVLLQFWQIQEILWIDVLTFLIAMVPLVITKIPSVKTSIAKSSFIDELTQGFSFVKNARGMLTVAILATALNFLIMPLSTLLPYYVKFDHFGGAEELALVMAFLQGGILCGGLLMSVKKGFEKKILTTLVSIVIAFSGYALIALTPTGSFWFMAVSALIFAVSLPVANVLLQTIMQMVVPLDMQGRVNSVTMALSMAAQPAGTLLSGAIVAFTTTSNLFLGCSIAGVALVIASWFFTNVRHLETLAKPAEVTLKQLHREIPVNQEK